MDLTEEESDKERRRKIDEEQARIIKAAFKKASGVDRSILCMLCYGYPHNTNGQIFHESAIFSGEFRGFVHLKELKMLYGPINVCWICKRDYGRDNSDGHLIITPPASMGLSFLPSSTNIYSIPTPSIKISER